MKYFSFSLKQLRIIQVIKNEVNLTNAGKNLYLSQPALSSQVKTLESNTYSKVLIRKKNQIFFTAEGELILSYANKILKLCEEADKAIVYFKKLKKFNLKIASTNTIGKNILLKLIELFCKRYPYANIYLQIGCTKSISWDIINGKIDLGIVPDEEVPKDLYYSLYSTPYFEEKIVLILPKFYKEKYLKTITKENLYKLNFITLKPYFKEREFMDTLLTRFNMNMKQLKTKLELNSIAAIKTAVGAGLGVSFLSTILIKEELYSKRFHTVLVDNINTYKPFILIVNLKKSESYLMEQFYNYCFTIFMFNSYNRFLNLS